MVRNSSCSTLTGGCLPLVILNDDVFDVEREYRFLTYLLFVLCLVP